MANEGSKFGEGERSRDGMSGSDLQRSQQAGSEGGAFTQAQQQGGVGGQQMGGGPSQADMAAPGGSSGSGGYGASENVQHHQGQANAGREPGMQQSRGEIFDEQQGGGRGRGSISGDTGDDVADQQEQGAGGSYGSDTNLGGYEEQGDEGREDIERDQRAHQDRGQGDIERP